MKLIPILLLLLLSACSVTQKPYVAMDIGYKLHETHIEYIREDSLTDSSHPISTGIESGVIIDDTGFTYGIRHDSQLFDGFPFNNDPEYQRTQLFIRYTHVFGEF